MRRLVPAAVTAVLGVGVGIGVPVAPATSAPASTSSVTLAPGVTVTHSSFGMRAGSRTLPERSVLVGVTLSAHTRLVAATPGRVIGAPRATTLATARQERAVAGINGDFFYFSDPHAVPRGGLTYDGRILKSALVDKRAALYVTTAGVASIGDPGLAGTVSTDTGRSYKLRSINSLENARNGGMTIVDHNMLTAPLPSCATATLAATPSSGRWRVTALAARATRVSRPGYGTRVLATCGPGRTWLHDALRVGMLVSVHVGYAVPGIRTLLSGGRVLIAAGRRYDDTAGLLGYGNQRKPESFACVLAGGRHVLLGAVEGDRPGAAGMTYAELTTYLLARGCRAAMTLDGSGSSTVVAKRPGRSLAVENHVTNRGGPRKVVDGLFVISR